MVWYACRYRNEDCNSREKTSYSNCSQGETHLPRVRHAGKIATNCLKVCRRAKGSAEFLYDTTQKKAKTDQVRLNPASLDGETSLPLYFLKKG